jgi:5-bromo-4-chloroindolyl phosphate hydrolysis protein
MVVDITILVAFLLFLIGEFGIEIIDTIFYICIAVLLCFEFTKILNKYLDCDKIVLNKTNISEDIETLEKELEENKKKTKELEQAIENVKNLKTVIEKKDIEIVYDSDELIIIKKISNEK